MKRLAASLIRNIKSLCKNLEDHHSTGSTDIFPSAGISVKDFGSGPAVRSITPHLPEPLLGVPD